MSISMQHGHLSHEAIQKWRDMDPVFAEMEQDCLGFMVCRHYLKLLYIGGEMTYDAYHAKLNELRVKNEDILKRLDKMKDNKETQDTALFCALMLCVSIKPDPFFGSRKVDEYLFNTNGKDIKVRVRHIPNMPPPMY